MWLTTYVISYKSVFCTQKHRTVSSTRTALISATVLYPQALEVSIFVLLSETSIGNKLFVMVDGRKFKIIKYILAYSAMILVTS